jgi:hypothetical protein
VGVDTGLWAVPAVVKLAEGRASHGRRETMSLEISTFMFGCEQDRAVERFRRFNIVLRWLG